MANDDDLIIETWKSKDLWSERELEHLCCGLAPDASRSSTDELNQAAEAIRRGVLNKSLPCVCPSDATAGDRLYGHARFFRPGEAIAWAAPKFPKFPRFALPETPPQGHTPASENAPISGPTFAKLQAAIAKFKPYDPPRSKKEFMLTLKDDGCDTREQEVFANIAAEHYGHTWKLTVS